MLERHEVEILLKAGLRSWDELSEVSQTPVSELPTTQERATPQSSSGVGKPLCPQLASRINFELLVLRSLPDN